MRQSPRKLRQEGKVTARSSDKEVVRNHGKRSFTAAVRGSSPELRMGKKARPRTGCAFKQSDSVGKEGKSAAARRSLEILLLI